MIDIFKHRLVPKARLMDEKEVEELLKKFKLDSIWKLPKILSTDPMARALNAKEGQVIEITRRSPTAGEAKYYRVVINE